MLFLFTGFSNENESRRGLYNPEPPYDYLDNHGPSYFFRPNNFAQPGKEEEGYLDLNESKNKSDANPISINVNQSQEQSHQNQKGFVIIFLLLLCFLFTFRGCGTAASSGATVKRCAQSYYGCCPNSDQAALGPNNTGCPSSESSSSGGFSSGKF